MDVNPEIDYSIDIEHPLIEFFNKNPKAYTLEELRTMQEHKKQRTGYYGKYAKCRQLSIEDMAEKIIQPKSIFEQILQGEQINNEILAGLATEMEAIKQQIQMVLIALYPPTVDNENTSEPTALGADNNE